MNALRRLARADCRRQRWLLFCLLGSICLTCASAVAQPTTRTQLAAIRRLQCVFSVSAVGGWERAEPRGRLSTEGVLSLQILDIDTEDASARVVGIGGVDTHVVARLSERSLHFLETDATGSLAITTVFGQQSRNGRLKAAHSRTSFLPVELPGFSAEPSVSQFYGECEVMRDR